MKKSNSRTYILLFLLPATVYLAIWRIGPLLYTIYASFTSLSLASSEPTKFVGMTNYSALLSDLEFIGSILLTLFFTIVVTGLELLVGLGMALVLWRHTAGRAVLRNVAVIPMVITPVVVGTIWYLIFHTLLGPVNYFMKLFGLESLDWLGSSKTALLSIMVADIWEWSPFMFLLLLAGLQSISKELFEAAEIDGASSWPMFRYITLPLIKNAMFVAVMLRSMDAFREFDKVYIMTGGGPGKASELVTVLVYRSAFSFFRLGYAAAMVMVSFCVLSVIYMSYLRVVK